HVQIPVGTIMRAYECQCGWWHLTRSSTPAEPIPYEDLTPADGDEQLLAGVGHNLFADVVARDIHGRGPIEEALALRHPTNALRWKEALKAAWIASEKQMAARRGDTSAQAKEWRARAEQYRAALRVRRLEAKRRAHPYPRTQGQALSPAEQVAVERARAAGRPRREQRRIAGDVAVKLLIAAHEDEFYGLFAAECERLGLPLTARDEARVQRGLGEAA
ncbi:hypothetical protein, partial [Streptomyces pilosus]|uniref:hypothetical protein n=2 Tax=Streptomyces TaxID=1883 RepID=UPI00331B0B05